MNYHGLGTSLGGYVLTVYTISCLSLVISEGDDDDDLRVEVE